MQENKILCPNCGKSYNSTYNYCPYCGQRKGQDKLAFREVLNDFLAVNLNYDSKLVQTIKTLFFYPARLTKEFIAGKRAKYVSPVRLYIIISLLFFLIITVSPGTVSLDQSDHQVKQVSSSQNNNLENLLNIKIAELKTKQGKTLFISTLRKNLSTAFILLIPIAALILQLLFPNKKFYVEHLIFSLHLQSLIMLLLIIFRPLELLLHNSFIGWAETAIVILILFVWLKSFYQKKLLGTFWRAVIFLALYSSLLLAIIIATTLISFLTF